MNSPTEIKGKKIAVLGLAPSGVLMVKALTRLGAAVTAFGYEGREKNQLLEQELKKLGCKGIFEPVGKDALLAYDLLIICTNTGLFLEAFEFARDKGVPAYTDIEFVTQFISGKVIAVTGSCGKSTTAGLIYQMLTKQGFKTVQLGGELPDFGGLLLQKKKLDYLVLEVSSSRLKGTTVFKPHIAVLLNIFFAHGERHHGSLLEYAETKGKIFQNQTAEDFLVFDGHASNLHELIRLKEAKAKLIKFSIESRVQPPGVYYEDAKIHATDLQGNAATFNLDRSRARGLPTTIMDIMAAVAVAQICGVQSDKIQEAINEFKHLPGRLRQIRRLDGVFFVDDSKATNIGATIWALHSYNKPIIWIVGGELGEKAHLSDLPTYAVGKVKRTIVIGSNTAQLASYLKNLQNIVEVGSLKKAVEFANQIAEAGDLVLFSPACPPDKFDSEAGFDRGMLFCDTVRALPRTSRLNLRRSDFMRI